MLCSLGDALEGALGRRRLSEVWWGARLLEVWPYAIGARYAKRARPLLERSDLREKGLLTVAVENSSWMHQLSFLDIAGLVNHQLGEQLVHTVRFELRAVGA